MGVAMIGKQRRSTPGGGGCEAAGSPATPTAATPTASHFTYSSVRGTLPIGRRGNGSQSHFFRFRNLSIVATTQHCHIATLPMGFTGFNWVLLGLIRLNVIFKISFVGFE